MPPARRSARTISTTTAREASLPYTRANRQTSPNSTRPTASIARPANGKTSLRLTVKAPPSKLRQATSGSQASATIPPNPYADNGSESDATPQPAVRIARSTRNPRTVVEPESDEEDEEEEGAEEEDDEEEEEQEEEEDDDDDDDDAEGEEDPDEDAEGDVEQELLANEDSEEDGEGEDEDMDGIELDPHPPPPIIKQDRSSGKAKPSVTVTAPPEGTLKSVEAKEMEDDEEELSELDSNDNDEEDDDDEDSDEEDMDGSRSATPDLSKLTRRQRGVYEEAADSSLMALSNEAQKKKHLTAEEHAMRRAEMARRRKNLSEKRNEEEKMDTINKLLKKPAPKRRTRAEIIAAQHAEAMAGTPGAEYGEEERPDLLFVRWVQSKEGSRLGVPLEWLEAPVGEMFKGYGRGRLAEEVG